MKIFNAQMPQKTFKLLLILISFTGLLLRFIDYDRIPPFGETQDEFSYPWSGMTLIQKGWPVGWSWFEAYPKRDVVIYWGATYPLVSPWVEKPPLYSLISGAIVLLTGATQLTDVRLNVIRLIPITLSFFTIILVGLVGKKLFGKNIGLLSALLYSSTPLLIVLNRLSLVESLLTPLILFSLLIYFRYQSHGKTKYLYLLCLTCFLIVLTKNIGFIIPLTIISTFLYRKKYHEAGMLTISSFLGAIIHPLLGAYFDWQLFISVLNNYRNAHGLEGVPQLIQTIFSFPTVASKEYIFPDGSILAGLILFFASPFVLKSNLEEKNLNLFLLVAFAYIGFLALLESGSTQFGYYGWHISPIYPFISIITAKGIYSAWQSKDLLKNLFFILIIGSSSIRFIILIIPSLQRLWQYFFLFMLLIFLFSYKLGSKSQKEVLIGFFLVYLLINIFVVFNLNVFFISYPQPQ